MLWLDGGDCPSSTQHRFTVARYGESADDSVRAMVRAGVQSGTPSTVLSDGDAGLWNLQRTLLPGATVVLDCFFADLFPSKQAAMAAAEGVVAEEHAPGETTIIEYEDEAGVWRQEVSQGDDRPDAHGIAEVSVGRR